MAEIAIGHQTCQMPVKICVIKARSYKEALIKIRLTIEPTEQNINEACSYSKVGTDGPLQQTASGVSSHRQEHNATRAVFSTVRKNSLSLKSVCIL